jgi:hypothetical protein
MKNTLINQTLEMLKKKDIQYEIKKIITPIIDIIFSDIYPYIYIIILFVCIIFIMILVILIILIIIVNTKILENNLIIKNP